MTTLLHRGTSCVVAIIIAILSPQGEHVHGAPVLIDIGFMEGGQFSNAQAVSADGTGVCGYGVGGDGNIRAFRWTLAGGIEDLGVFPLGWQSTATGISGDASIVTGFANIGNGGHAFLWTALGGMQDLGAMPGGSVTYPFAVSGDGLAIVGKGDSNGGLNQAFRWSVGASMHDLGSLGEGQPAEARAISCDGSIVVGWSRYYKSGDARAFRWNNETGMQDLGLLPGYVFARAHGISGDGTVIVGETGPFSNSQAGTRAFRWTTAEGMQDLGVFPGGNVSHALAISADGSTIVGFGDSEGYGRAFMWTEALGMVDLQVYLASVGVNLGGWTLGSANGVSGDGSIIAGHGGFGGQLRAWVVDLNPISADMDRNGAIDGRDIQEFVDALHATCTNDYVRKADLNDDFAVDAVDIAILTSALLNP